MKRALILTAMGLSLAAASGVASAHTDFNVMLGVPVAPVYAAPPPPVIYQEAPVAYAAPAYGYGYGYREDGWDHDDDRRWHDHGRHRGWYKHHHGDDDD
ncbi:conserved exported hypothetical protein [Paraburkholderia tropica]|uniref:hypothetical protein n=1 Tax=Paraburkholderia TaxID=1822464 RepID=UPI001CAEF7DE|nr:MULTISPECIES: hypothetical protein [Paraburkholderia]CAG9235422.1 conserved exported hypothetical protein [Paraburkholderia tropica]